MNLGFDPIIGSEIIELLGLADYEVNNPKKYQQLKDVVDYYATDDNRRFSILKLLAGKQGEKLDIVWTYVELQREKQAKVQSLNPQDFEKDVAEEITKGYVTKDNIKKVKDDIQKRKEELKKKQLEEERYERKVDSAMDKAFKDLEVTNDTLTDIELINNELDFYG